MQCKSTVRVRAKIGRRYRRLCEFITYIDRDKTAGQLAVVCLHSL